MKCTRCGRTLKRPPVHGMGPVCLRAVTGAKPKRIRRAAAPNEKQVALFEEKLP